MNSTKKLPTKLDIDPNYNSVFFKKNLAMCYDLSSPNGIAINHLYTYQNVA